MGKVLNRFDISLFRKWTRFYCLCTSVVAILLLCLPILRTSIHRSQTEEEDNLGTKLLLSQFPENVSKLISILKDKHKTYLKPTNILFSNFGPNAVHPNIRQLLGDIIRYGYGLQPYITDRGEDAWVENGIVHRPSRTINPYGFTPEFESYVPFDEDMFFEGRTPDPMYKSKRKIILWYVPPTFVAPIPGLKSLTSCPEFPCVISTNASLYGDESSASIFAANKIKAVRPPRRTSENQVFVLHNHEPPNFLTFSKMTEIGRWAWREAFNWTFTFRSDSDLVVPFAVVRKRPGNVPLTKDYRDILAKKTKLVAWAVSHCSTIGQRETYVEILKKYIHIDIIGACGVDDCPRTKREYCTDQIGRHYKFYLAFENAISIDYITEKMFHIMSRDIVVVARGSDEYFKHFPPEIFINTNDFASPKDLAYRLLYLDKNDEPYLSILREKNKYMTMTEDRGILPANGKLYHTDFMYDNVPLCLMCQWLWNIDKHRKTNKDVYEWLEEGQCRVPKDIID